MAQTLEHNPASPEAIKLGYEPSAIGARGPLIFLVCFVVCAAGLHVFVWKVMEAFEEHDMTSDRPQSVVAPVPGSPSPPLQPSVDHDELPQQDLEALRTSEDRMLQRWGWTVNTATHEAAIPPSIVQQVARETEARAASTVQVPATTTGQNRNTIVPGPPPPYDTQPNIDGGHRP